MDIQESKENNETTRRSRAREINSRYKSLTPAGPTGPCRYPLPGVARSATPSRQPLPNKSVERKHPSTPPSPSRKLNLNKIPESLLWPSTMRSLNNSFKPDTLLNGNPVIRRNATPERKKSPLKGKNAPDNSENNNKTVDISHSRLVEQNMWPSRTDKNNKSPFFRSLKKSSSEVSNLASLTESGNLDYKPVSLRFWGRTNQVMTPGGRSRSLPTTPDGSRASSPNRGTSFIRGVSPVHSRPSSPFIADNNSNKNSVLTFIADIKKNKKCANHIEDVNELRLIYNRHLQWRFANARASAVLRDQKLKAEKMLYNVCETTSQLWDFVIEKRNELQQLKLRLKLHTTLSEQMEYLEDWSTCEIDHLSSLSHAGEDLRTSILSLPITRGARGDIGTVKAAICSAIDVMRAMGSSISSILAKMEGMNSLVSELANVAARGRAAVHGCEALLASISDLEAEEHSLGTHFIQMKKTKDDEQNSD